MNEIWKFEEAQNFIILLNKELRKIGFGIGITGSLLLNLESNNDLDLIIYPLNSSIYDLSEVFNLFNLLELKRLKPRSKTLEKFEKIAQLNNTITDNKHVEAWITKNNKKIDFFFLK